MELYYMPRAGGKTTKIFELFQKAKAAQPEKNPIIITFSDRESLRLIDSYQLVVDAAGLPVLHTNNVMTWEKYHASRRGAYRGNDIALIDNADLILQSVIPCPIHAITITKDKKDEKNNSPEQN